MKTVILIGFCGGYTTFSTLAAENISLIQNQQFLLAFTYIGLSLTLWLLDLDGSVLNETVDE